ncbi:MAG: 50S ribosomal protein L24 [Elusimicrobiota bacterium]|jgi:large subunit ribosomal protein L24|nr:50S ribosomal protein L24 [Elusimicrobiota bacterium]
MLTVKKNDRVVVLSGKDRGKKGNVLCVIPGKNSVVVSKVNFVKRHTKPTRTDAGGIKEKEAAMDVSNVMLLCPKCDRPSRVKFDRLSDMTKIRVCRKCGEIIA